VLALGLGCGLDSAPTALSPSALDRAEALAEQAAAKPPNRDTHGPDDVDLYIRGLESDARVAELQPEVTLDRLPLAPSTVVADIGCGPGVFALPMAARCADCLIYAVDVEPRQLDALAERMRERGLHNIIPVLGSYDDPHLPPHGVDLVFIADTYHHLENRVAYLRALRDDLRPGAMLAILEYKPGDLPVGPPADHKTEPGVREAELAEAGYTGVQAFDTHKWHDFELWQVAPSPASAAP